MGSYVYLFNLHTEPILSLTVNGAPAGSIAGSGTYSGAPPYTPARLAVSRARYPIGPAAFVPGDNHLRMQLESFGSVSTVTIPSPDTSLVGPDVSLLLLLALDGAVLLTAEARMLDLFRVDMLLPEPRTVADSVMPA